MLFQLADMVADRGLRQAVPARRLREIQRLRDGNEITQLINVHTVSPEITILNFEYDDGYGITEVNMGLKLVGKDFWLERHEYDGSEWWEYKTLPIYNEDFACDISEIPIAD